MPNGRAHAIIGAGIGGAAGLYAAQGEPDYAQILVALGAIFGGRAGGRTPDLLEPAIHPHHRDFFHSATAGSVLAWRGSQAYSAARQTLLADAARLRSEREMLPLDDSRRAWLGLAEAANYLAFGAMLGFVVGYLSHIAADLSTARGVPIMSRRVG